mgnify:CR=1 FL=1
MSLKETITGLIEQEIHGSEYFIVQVNANAAESSIKIYIDGDKGVDIGYCARLSRRISAQLDEMEIEHDRFRYEISSPGADKPLLMPRQYNKHLGRELEVELNSGESSSGVLSEISEQSLSLEVLADPKKKQIEKRKIAFGDIKQSTVQISFKSKKA